MGNGPVLIVSACLVGYPTRYDGRCTPVAPARLLGWCRSGRALAICPEIAGGLPVPRPPAEIHSGDGCRVWRGYSRVFTREHVDVTAPFLRGARIAARLVNHYGIRVGLFKDGSPSCGVTRVYDGTFQGRSTTGLGVTTAGLKPLGVQLFTESDMRSALCTAAGTKTIRNRKLTGSGNLDILLKQNLTPISVTEAAWPIWNGGSIPGIPSNPRHSLHTIKEK